MSVAKRVSEEMEVNAYVKDSTAKGVHVFAFTSAAMKEMDRKFSEALDSLTWDVEGELIMTLTICAFRSAIQNLHHGGARDLQPPRVEFHSDIPGSLLLMVSQVNWHL
ncbi:hypothetical protein HGRIS_004291 [Hohenbuehelia grisea]|uniref:Uncharacterized protein n=1 Tax=Hohenbuehelia grisea TaxID=104357 RepID=A0ABR3IPC1_9AGAR